MATVTLKGNPVETSGALPPLGSLAPDFVLTTRDLTDVGLAAFGRQKKVLSVVPSLDTRVCALSAQRFNTEVQGWTDVVVLNISCDLPYASKRFCDSQNLSRIVSLSQLRNRNFGQDYGLTLTSGPMAGLLARAVLVLDADNRIRYQQLVPEISQEPDYAAVWQALAAI